MGQSVPCHRTVINGYTFVIVIRTAIGRVLISRASRFAAVMGLTVTGMLVAPAGPLRADSVDDQRRRVAEIVDELERIAA